MGIRASATRELIFEDCKVPKENLLGKEGMGFIIAMRTFDITRPVVAAQSLGIAQGALDESIKYAKERIQFGKPIITLQAIQHKLADMATKIEAARLLVYKAAVQYDRDNKIDPKLSSMSKWYPARVSVEVADEAIEILGGHGYMLENEVERFYRDARQFELVEGTREIHKNTIARALLGKLE